MGFQFGTDYLNPFVPSEVEGPPRTLSLDFARDERAWRSTPCYFRSARIRAATVRTTP